MPRKRDRFRKLKEKLKDSLGSPTAGSDADGYLKFITGQSNFKITNKVAAGGKKRGVVGLKPFNIGITDIIYAAPITKVSHKRMTEAGVTGTDAGHTTFDDGEAKHKRDSAYNPAIIQFSYASAGAKTAPKTSQITNKEYQRLPTLGGTVPFGKKTDADTEDGRAKALMGAVKSKTGGVGATYQPEEWNAQSILPPIENVPDI